MATALPPVPFNAPMLGADGMLTQVWKDYFLKADQRMGGRSSLSNDELRDRLVTPDYIDATVAGSGLAGGAGNPLSVGVDNSTLEISSDQIRAKDNGIPFVKLLSTDWTKSANASGYQKLPSGVYIQWGVTASLNSGTTTSISLPVAFPTSCLQVVTGIQGNSAVSTASTGQWGTGNYSTTAFDLYNRTSVALTFNYIAVGY